MGAMQFRREQCGVTHKEATVRYAISTTLIACNMVSPQLHCQRLINEKIYGTDGRPAHTGTISIYG